MRGSDLFDLYRQLLAILAGSYGAVRLGHFIWRFQMTTRAAPRIEAMLRRYLVAQLLRVRISRFGVDLLQVAGLSGLLGYLLWLHWQ
jgi:hypothetical protein